MSGEKGQKHYSEEIKNEVRQKRAAGESLKAISREMGVSKYSAQSWCGLRPETQLRQIAPLPKGCPKAVKIVEDYEKENKRLRMEIELMRDFLRYIGKR